MIIDIGGGTSEVAVISLAELLPGIPLELPEIKLIPQLENTLRKNIIWQLEHSQPKK